MTNTPHINPDHPRIKHRDPEIQKQRDEIAKTLREEKSNPNHNKDRLLAISEISKENWNNSNLTQEEIDGIARFLCDWYERSIFEKAIIEEKKYILSDKVANLFKQNNPSGFIDNIEEYPSIFSEKTQNSYKNSALIYNKMECDNDIVRFSFDEKNAENADIILLYRDNDLYTNLMTTLSQKNLVAGKKIYVFIIPQNATMCDNPERLTHFIEKYHPITDATMEKRSNTHTQTTKILPVESGDSNILSCVDSLKIVNDLIKLHNINSVKLLTKTSHHQNFMLEHWGIWIDANWEFISYPYSAVQDKDTIEPVKKFRQTFITNAKVEIINEEDIINTNIEKINTLLVSDRHRVNNYRKDYEKGWWKVLSIAGDEIYTEYLDEKYKSDRSQIYDKLADSIINTAK